MYVEYCNYNKYIESYEQELKTVFKAIDKGIQGFALPIHMIREIREYIPDTIVLAAPIDYPSGYSSTKVRNHMVLNSVQSGANAIDYVPNQYLLRSKFTELKDEIKTVLNICNDYGATLRIFLDYRYSGIISIAKQYVAMGIDIGFCTIGYHHDDFYDNLINCKLLSSKTGMSTIFNGYIWTNEQIQLVKQAKTFGIRLYNVDFWCI